MTSRSTVQQVTIRDLESIDDLRQLKEVEKEVWRMTDEDTLPLTLAIACKAAGNIFIGAFEKDKDKDKNRNKIKIKIKTIIIMKKWSVSPSDLSAASTKK